MLVTTTTFIWNHAVKHLLQTDGMVKHLLQTDGMVKHLLQTDGMD